MYCLFLFNVHQLLFVIPLSSPCYFCIIFVILFLSFSGHNYSLFPVLFSPFLLLSLYLSGALAVLGAIAILRALVVLDASCTCLSFMYIWGAAP